jgi:hypothetical protein
MSLGIAQEVVIHRAFLPHRHSTVSRVSGPRTARRTAISMGPAARAQSLPLAYEADFLGDPALRSSTSRGGRPTSVVTLPPRPMRHTVSPWPEYHGGNAAAQQGSDNHALPYPVV